MTELFITVKGIGFTIFQDRTRKHNLISPAFLSFFREDYLPSKEEYLDNQRVVETIVRNSKEAFPVLLPLFKMYCFKDVFKVVGHGMARCSDNKLRWCRTVQFSFEHNCQTYKQLFYIDKSLCVTAVLGKYFEAIDIHVNREQESALLQHVYSTCRAFVDFTMSIACNIGKSTVAYNRDKGFSFIDNTDRQLVLSSINTKCIADYTSVLMDKVQFNDNMELGFFYDFHKPRYFLYDKTNPQDTTEDIL